MQLLLAESPRGLPYCCIFPSALNKNKPSNPWKCPILIKKHTHADIPYLNANRQPQSLQNFPKMGSSSSVQPSLVPHFHPSPTWHKWTSLAPYTRHVPFSLGSRAVVPSSPCSLCWLFLHLFPQNHNPSSSTLPRKLVSLSFNTQAFLPLASSWAL